MSYATKLRIAYARMMGDYDSMPASVAGIGTEADAEIAALRKRAEEAEADNRELRRLLAEAVASTVEPKASEGASTLTADMFGGWDAARKEETRAAAAMVDGVEE